MRSIFAIALVTISLTLVACQVNNERSKLMAEAMDCCTTVCGHQEYSLLRTKFELFAAQYGHDSQLDTFLENIFSGELCNRKAPKASFAGITCPPGPYDCGSNDVIVNCTYDVYHSIGVYYGSVSAYAVNGGGGSVSYMSNSGYYFDSTYSSVFWSGVVQLLVRQYSPAGLYAVNIYSYSANYSSYISATANFTVAATVNDNQAPALVSVSIPPINLFDFTSAFAAVTATDDRSGVAQIQVTISNATTSIAYGYYTAPYNNGKYTALTSITAALTMYFYSGGSSIQTGRYNISLYLYDAIGRYKYVYLNDLIAASLQTQVIIDQSFCPAGKYLPYGLLGACLTCPFGAFSPNFAFRCKACPVGTWPNGTGSCAPCPAGSYGVGGSSYCQYCPAGTYTYSTGARTCQPCSPGTFSGVGATTCSNCPAGTYSVSGSTASGCTPCPKGTASSYSYYGCQPCEAGFFAAADGTASCAQCPPGTYSDSIRATSCTNCPLGQSGPTPSNSILNCA